jgi:hypothetical protein
LVEVLGFKVGLGASGSQGIFVGVISLELGVDLEVMSQVKVLGRQHSHRHVVDIGAIEFGGLSGHE